MNNVDCWFPQEKQYGWINFDFYSNEIVMIGLARFINDFFISNTAEQNDERIRWSNSKENEIKQNDHIIREWKEVPFEELIDWFETK